MAAQYCHGTFAIGPFFLTLLYYSYIIIYLFFKTHSCSMLHKALSTCVSHFMVVVLFYTPVVFTYIHPATGSSVEQEWIIAIMYSVVTPVLNPLIYTLRNKEVKGALRRGIRRRLWPEVERILLRHKGAKRKLTCEVILLF